MTNSLGMSVAFSQQVTLRSISSSKRQCVKPRSQTCELTRKHALKVIDDSVHNVAQSFVRQDLLTKRHMASVLNAFREERIGQHHFCSPDGYAHGDLGRDALEAVYARFFGCEAALVRIQFFSGTHAIGAVLFGLLRPGDELLSATGPVYDTLEEVIGLRESIQNCGSLQDFGITFREHPLLSDGTVDIEGLASAISSKTKVVFIQRSFGYEWRPSLTIANIKDIVEKVHKINSTSICFVDNCYGEMTEEVEPVHPSVGADIMAGSLIKNLGAGIVPSGAYVAGRSKLVSHARARLSAPGIGGGATLGFNRTMFQGLFMAPGIIGEACKGSLLVADVMARLGYATNPVPGTTGFVRAVCLGDKDRVVRFCRAVQRNGPVGAYIEPTVGHSDGYGDEVVFAQGTFIDGSTVELSADGPLREPFAVFAQGGVHWTHWAVALEDIIVAVGRAEELND